VHGCMDTPPCVGHALHECDAFYREGGAYQVPGPTGEMMQVPVPQGAVAGTVVNVPVTVYAQPQQQLASAPAMVMPHAEQVQLLVP
jgi:hypothetical protein